jgi:hypothetical protein
LHASAHLDDYSFKYTSEEVNRNFNEAAAKYAESTDKVRDVREALKVRHRYVEISLH